MSFSRRIGASPSIRNVARTSELVTRLWPMMIRSPGFSTTLNDIVAPLRPPTEQRLKFPEYRKIGRRNYAQNGFAATRAAQAGRVQILRLGQSCNLNGATLSLTRSRR